MKKTEHEKEIVIISKMLFDSTREIKAGKEKNAMARSRLSEWFDKEEELFSLDDKMDKLAAEKAKLIDIYRVKGLMV